MKITTRPATVLDEAFVNALTRKTMRPYVEATWQTEEEREEYYRLNLFREDGTEIVQVDEVGIGRITVDRTPHSIVLDEIHIVPEFQGRGIGHNLLVKVLQEAEQLGLSVELKVLKNNPAQRLYSRLGFIVEREANERLYMKRHVSSVG